MSVGEKLRRLREAKGVGVRGLARLAGVSPSLISQIENNQVTPSYSTLKSIALALGETEASFLVEDVPEEWVVVRSDSIRPVFTGEEGVEVSLYAFPGPRDKKMQSLVVTLEPGAIMSAASVSTIKEADGDDMIHVLEGSVEITTDKRRYLLKTQDAAYLTYEEIHSVAARGGKARILWVSCKS